MSIEYRTNGAIATFTIANGKVNPITPAMHREMAAALRDFLADPDLRVGILTGAGERAFSAGDDIKSEAPGSGSAVTDLLAAMGSGPRHETDPDPAGWDGADAVLRLERTKPIIGAVRGWCLGRAMIYLLRLTDIRICTPDSRFGLPEIAYGMGGLAGAMQLAHHITPVVAWEMALTGEPIDAAEAVRAGLVNRIVEPEALLPEAQRIAGLIARHPPLAVRVEMEAMRRTALLDADTAYAVGSSLYRLQRLAIGESDIQAEFLYKQGSRGGG